MLENSSDEDSKRVNGDIESQDAKHIVSKGNAGFLFKVSESTDRLSSLDNDGTLPLKAGDIVVLLSTRGRDGDWWYGEKIGESSKKGFFRPSSVMRLVASDPDVSSFEVPHEELQFNRTTDFLGKGGFAQVYSGYLRGTKVAIKVPSAQSMQNDPNLLKKLKKEAYIQHSLKHENIVKLIKMSIDNPVEPCLVLEFCAGGSLTPIIYHRAIAPRILLDWALQIARGMRYLHCSAPIPIIHKDLKSNNILIAQAILPDDDFQNKTMKITDFGLAKPIEFENQPQTSTQGGGTFAWMAPEVIKRSLYTHASDAWSFGVVFWEMLLGLPPYEGIPYHTVLYKIGEHNLTLPIPEHLEGGFAAILRGCWDISVGTRKTFGQIENELSAMIKKFEEWPDLTGEEYVHNRREHWYRDINYDYITNVGGQEMVTFHLVEQLLRERKEKRDAQLRLAENELREALNANSVHRKSKGRNIKRKKELNCESISFPQGDVKHIIGVTDEELSRSISGSVDMLFHESAKSPLTPVKSPQISRFGGTWDHRRRPQWNGRPMVDRSHFDYDNSYMRGMGVDTGSLCNRSKDLNRSKSCKDKFSQSESNILNIGAAMEASVNRSTESANDAEAGMSISDSISDTKETRFYNLIKRFYKKKNSKEKKNSNSPTVGTPLRVPQQSFVRSESQRGPKVVDRGVSTPQRLITISSGAQRPTNLEISSPYNKSFYSGSTTGHYMSSYSDEFEASHGGGTATSSRLFSPSNRQMQPPVSHFSPAENGGFSRIDEASNSPPLANNAAFYCNSSLHSNSSAAATNNLNSLSSSNHNQSMFVCSPNTFANSSHMFVSPSFNRKHKMSDPCNGGYGRATGPMSPNHNPYLGGGCNVAPHALMSPLSAGGGDVDNNNSYILDNGSPSCAMADHSPALPPRQLIVAENNHHQHLQQTNQIIITHTNHSYYHDVISPQKDSCNSMMVTRREHYTSHQMNAAATTNLISHHNNHKMPPPPQQQLSLSSSSSMSGSNPDCNSLPRRTETLTSSDQQNDDEADEQTSIQSQTLVFSNEMEVDEKTMSVAADDDDDSPISFPTCPPPPVPPRPGQHQVKGHHPAPPGSREISPNSCGFLQVCEKGGPPHRAIVTASPQPHIVNEEGSCF